MLPWTLREAAALANGRVAKGDGATRVAGVCHDTRAVERGFLFTAVKGERFDGHDFLAEAKKRGAAAALVSRVVKGVSLPQVLVGDTTRALGDLGRSLRLQWGGPVVAVTGSVGKTTVKDLTAHLLAGKYEVLKTKGNLNNHFGLPLTLLKLKPGHQTAVVELGINHPGEMERLSDIARPDVAVVTAIGEAHLGNFRGKRQLAAEKLKIASHLRPGGTVVLNAEDGYLKKDYENKKTFGLSQGTLRAKGLKLLGLKTQFALWAEGRAFRTSLAMLGEHNVQNALAAATAAMALGVGAEECAHRLATFKVEAPMRMELKKRNGILFINDAYNASPTSMVAALSAFERVPASGSKYAVLGDMLELGDYSLGAHAQILRLALMEPLAGLVLVGDAMGEALDHTAVRKGLRVWHFPTAKLTGKFLKRKLAKGDAVLLKGSRGMALEKVLEAF
ncbi:MAG TPA: UDP-N-acetylmuramoyl-tripeptide--D-alanyl-D-alanine ligase [bacterium]|nr:UDP-N-acetylmuramoyl-tripeptide--D-alanyl-D-alanine ligase [bacterium]